MQQLQHDVGDGQRQAAPPFVVIHALAGQELGLEAESLGREQAAGDELERLTLLRGLHRAERRLGRDAGHHALA